MQNSIDLKDILRTLNKQKGMIAVIFVVFVVAAVIISYSIAPTYEASATMRIKQKQGLGNSLLNEMPGGFNMTKELMSTYAEMIKSRTVVNAVIDKTWVATKSNEKRPTYEGFVTAITTTPVRDTQILKVSVRGPSPELAKKRTNALVDSFNDRLAELSQLEQKMVKDFIGKRLAEIKTELDTAENTLAEYKEANKITQPSDETKAVLDTLANLDKIQAQNEVETATAEAQLAAATKQLATESPGFKADSVYIQALKGKLADAEVQKMMLEQQYTAKHPQVMAVQASIDEIKSKLDSETERIATANAPSGNPVHIALLQAQITAGALAQAGAAKRVVIAGEVAKRMQNLSLLPKKEYDLVKLVRDAKVTEQMYTMMSQRYEEARINEVMTPRDVQVVDYAVAPSRPISPNKTMNVMVAALLGLFAGVVLAIGLDYFKKTIRSADDVEFYLKLPVLGQIPDYSIKQRGFYGRLRKNSKQASR